MPLRPLLERLASWLFRTADRSTTILRNLAAVVSITFLILLLWISCASLVRSAAPPDPVALKVQGPDQVGTPIPVIQFAPGTTGSNQTAITASASAGNTTNTATLAASAGKLTYISGFAVTAAGATAGLAVNVTITGCVTGTMNYTFVFPAGVAVGANPLVVNFELAVPSSAANTAIVVTCPAGGAGNTNAAVSAWGYQQ